MALVILALGCASSARARADETDECLAAHAHGQELRQDGHSRAARDAFRKCAADACPAAVRSDCAQWTAEVEAAIPSLIVDAKDAGGHDTTGVRVLVDGEAPRDYAEGRAFELDPGAHRLRVVAADGREVEQ